MKKTKITATKYKTFKTTKNDNDNNKKTKRRDGRFRKKTTTELLEYSKLERFSRFAAETVTVLAKIDGFFASILLNNSLLTPRPTLVIDIFFNHISLTNQLV